MTTRDTCASLMRSRGTQTYARPSPWRTRSVSETDKERGRTSSRNGTMALRSMGRWLAETGTLARSDGGNLLDPLKPPKTPKRKRQALTDEDLDAIWAALAERPKQERYRAVAFVRLQEATGLRRTEVGALVFNDVEFDENGLGGWVTTRTTRRNVGQRRIRLDADAVAATRQYIEEERPEYGTVAVVASLQPTSAGLTLVEPKSKRSRRVINIEQRVVAALRRHRARQLQD